MKTRLGQPCSIGLIIHIKICGMKKCFGKFVMASILFGFPWAAYPQKTRVVFQDIEWSPTGDFIAFSAIKVKPDWSDYSKDGWRIYTYNPKSNVLTSLCNACVYFSVLTDGHQIVYDKVNESGKDIYIMDMLTGTGQRVLANKGKNAGPSWSPDGSHFVFYSDEEGNEELFTFGLKSGEKKQITKRTDGKSYNPVWSPFSNQIVYYLEKGDNKDQIYLTDMDGSFQRNLTNDDHHNIFPSWTPDGRIIYVRDKGEVMIMNVDGTNKERILGKSGGLAVLSPDGKKLLFVADDASGLSILDLDSKKEERLFLSSDLIVK